MELSSKKIRITGACIGVGLMVVFSGWLVYRLRPWYTSTTLPQPSQPSQLPLPNEPIQSSQPSPSSQSSTLQLNMTSPEAGESDDVSIELTPQGYIKVMWIHRQELIQQNDTTPLDSIAMMKQAQENIGLVFAFIPFCIDHERIQHEFFLPMVNLRDDITYSSEKEQLARTFNTLVAGTKSWPLSDGFSFLNEKYRPIWCHILGYFPNIYLHLAQYLTNDEVKSLQSQLDLHASLGPFEKDDENDILTPLPVRNFVWAVAKHVNLGGFSDKCESIFYKIKEFKSNQTHLKEMKDLYYLEALLFSIDVFSYLAPIEKGLRDEIGLVLNELEDAVDIAHASTNIETASTDFKSYFDDHTSALINVTEKCLSFLQAIIDAASPVWTYSKVFHDDGLDNPEDVVASGILWNTLNPDNLIGSIILCHGQIVDYYGRAFSKYQECAQYLREAPISSSSTSSPYESAEEAQSESQAIEPVV
ncbi:hypothetical protein NEHOM01_2214 [Nematocida homosporus]|uniref:uncharacterized protein n=1 Tax=Nematocida homosporus TaxID=1912981 RepID=UPI0022206379|nr:uncharacterized protein NEHOM01_2214 [Nematocida homosporus]KAI5187484.1 hypothetical protein NEHOM01_2214 [Nematocida homosporus]